MKNNSLKTLGKSDIQVPSMGIGTASWGDKKLGYGKAYSFDDIMQAYTACLDAGLNFFDTAEMYGKGESERLIGECRRKDGRQIIVSSKFAPHTMLTPSRKRSSPQALLTELDKSLQRLGVEYIDLYQLHLPPAQNKLNVYLDVLAEAVHANKIKAVGVCNFTASLLRQAYERLAEHGIPLASTMVGYNLLRRFPETNGVLDACRELDVALIAYAPLAEGILTGKYRNGNKSIPEAYWILIYLEQLDFLKERGTSVPIMKKLFSKPRNLKINKLEKVFIVLEEIAKAHKKTIAQVAINWLMTSDSRVIPIPGAKNLKQASENIGALGWNLTKEEYFRISEAEIATH